MTTSVLAPAFQSPLPTHYNAVRHGLLSRYVVLPWENRDEYETLLRELIDEHGPVGPTEAHLVEELAGFFWRKRRLRIAELATYRKALHDEAVSFDGTQALAGAALMGVTGQTKSKASLPAALASASSNTKSELRDIRRDKAMTTMAWGILQKGGPDAYEAALAVLREDTRTYWAECLEESDTDLAPTAEALRG